MPQAAVRYNHIPVQQSTFKAGLSAHVHRWFRLTPSFGPDLVREMLEQLNWKEEEIVFDPFSGAGTTLIESKLNNIKSIGCEINPFLYWIGKASTNWSLNVDILKSQLFQILDRFDSLKTRVTFDNLEKHNLKIPSIHNPLRWWREDILIHLLIIKNSINLIVEDEQNRDFFLLEAV